MYLTIRVVHVLFGALWVGVAVMSAMFLVPAVKSMGPDAAKFAAAMQRRGFVVAIPVIAGLAILSGFWLYWRFTSGFNAEISRSRPGMAYGTGGIVALVAFVIGGMMIGRSTAAAVALAEKAATTKNEAERAGLLARAAMLRQRAAVAGQVVAILVVITTILMASALHLPG